jgi:hypothetical protein
MPLAASDKIRSRLEHLETRRQAADEAIRRHQLETGAAIVEAQKGIEQDLREGLREGLEREALLGALAAARSQAESDAKMLVRALAIFEGDAAAPTIEQQLRETEGFLIWVRGLEARVSAPVPPFDESRLPRAPDGPTAEGYVSVGEARARVRAGKKP